MAHEDEADNGSCLTTLALLLVGIVPLLTMGALIYFTVETVAGRMDYCTLWTDVPGRLAILVISYYVAGLCGYFPIPECCFMNCFPQPLLLWRRSTWGNFFRSCLSTPNLYIRFRESLRVANSSSLPLQQDERQDSFRNGPSPISHRGRSEPTAISFPQSPALEDIVNPCPNRPVPAALDQRRRNDTIHESSEELFNSTDSSPRGCIIPMVIGKGKPPYLPSSLEASTEQVNDPFQQQITDVETPSTEDGDIPLPNYPRLPWIYLRNPNGRLPNEAFKTHKMNLKIEKNLVKRQERLQKGKDQNAVRTESSEEKGAKAGGSAVERLLQLQSNKSRRSCIGEQSRRRSESRSSSKSSKFHKRAHSDRPNRDRCTNKGKEIIPKCCEHSTDLKSKVDRIKKFHEKIRDSTSTQEGKDANSRLEAETSTSKSGPAVSSRLTAKTTELSAETSKEKVGVRTLGHGLPGTSQSGQPNPSRLQVESTEVLDETSRESVGIPTHGSVAPGATESGQEVSSNLQVEETEELDVGASAPEAPTSSNRESEEQSDKISVISRKDKADK